MELSFSALGALLRETLRDPQAAARRVMAVDLPDGARWQALALVVVLSVLLVQVAMMLTAGPEVMGGVWRSALLQGGVLVVTVLAVHHIGRGFGGTGTLRDAVILVAWLQFVTLCFQVAQIFVLLIAPPLASLVAIASIAVFLWLLVSFVQALHGFRSRGLVLLGLVVSFFALAFALSLVLAVLGFEVPGGFDDV
ncbi:Yip1 family protein [Plastorhodobacter daqingensis]|uniref:Yip1 family protein n=1 Tax=Plastorhodobacter daqingensis TaxID=1387281 RepID=A0ABW2UHN7_9RHOB